MPTSHVTTAPRPADRVPPRRPAARPRDPWFDNAKLLLVTLVVAGHSWVLLPEGSLARNWAYDYLYVWHMPAFLVVTGYLSRSFTWNRRNLGRLVTTVAVPYVIFEALMALFRVQVGGEEPLDRLFLEPHWPMWFLAALFFWRLATPALKAVPAPLVVATAVSLLGGLLPGDVLDVGRVTGMLPFFVLGLVARPEHVQRLRERRWRRPAVAVLAAGFALAPLVDGTLRTEWFYWRSGYDVLGVSFLEGAAIRLVLLAVATVLALSALTLVPATTTWFTRLGGATMVVYLFHGFFIKAASYTDLFGWSSVMPWAGLITLTGAAVVLALVLATPPVARRLDVVIDPIGSFRRWRRGDRTGERADVPLEDRADAGGAELPHARVPTQHHRPVSYLPL